MNNFLFAGAALIVAVPALAQVAPAPVPAPQIQRAPMAAKVTTRAEVQAKVAEHFARMDSNRDGFVTKAEADSAREAMRGQMREHFAERLAGRGPRGDAGQAFERLDANKDGAISRSEWDAGRAQRQQRVAARHEGGEGGGMKRMHRMGGMGALHGRMFELADANKDGRVSLQEAQAAALRHFDTADANRDGQITPDERRQVRERVRVQRRGG